MIEKQICEDSQDMINDRNASLRVAQPYYIVITENLNGNY